MSRTRSEAAGRPPATSADASAQRRVVTRADPVGAPRNLVGAVATSMRILRRLAEASEPQTVTQIARDLGINPSTCFSILRTLVAEDFAVFDPLSKAYGAGRGVQAIAAGVYRGGIDIALLQKHLAGFAIEFDATVTLWRRIGERMVLAAAAEGDGAHIIRMRLGQRVPLLLGATGRCVAAFGDIPDDTMAARFARVKWEQAMTLEVYRRQVAETRRRGWARDEGQYARSVTSVAAPVGRDRGPVEMVVGASTFTGQYSARSLSRVGEHLSVLGDELASLV